MKKKPVLAGFCPEELSGLLNTYPAFRSRQIHEWICRGALTFDEMSSLPAHMRKELNEKFTLLSGEVSSELRDRDGTVKLGIKLEDGAVLESVILNDGKNRKTACLSTQAGCPIGCVFCKTGKIGFKRNLEASEIVSQFLYLLKKEAGISHIVIMGMGEPLLNLEELRKAVNFFTYREGLDISKRRITLSTCGIVKGLNDFTEGGPDIKLALSLTSAREELRQRIMPISRENSLPSLKEALLAYQKKRKRRITLEIVLLGGINTSVGDADEVSDFAGGLDTVINLIPWNPVDGLEFESLPLKAPASKETKDFALALEKRGLKVTYRTEKGRGISGACGQLGGIT